MFKVIGLDGEEIEAKSFTEALTKFYALFPESFAEGKIPRDSEKKCYIEAVGETATARMYYPYVFEFAVKAGLIKDGK